MAIYTNGSPEEIDSQRVVQLICRRWGQENLIKELLGKHFINYMPGYVREGMKEQPLVNNPQVTRLKKRRGFRRYLRVKPAAKMPRRSTAIRTCRT